MIQIVLENINASVISSCIRHSNILCTLNVPQDTVCPLREADTAVLLTAPTCMCLGDTTQTLRRQADQKMKTTLFSESFGGFILPQPPGSRSVQRVTCLQSWHLCQVWTGVLPVILSELHSSGHLLVALKNQLLVLLKVPCCGNSWLNLWHFEIFGIGCCLC